jgi:F-type H+-transporting ATPase subunit b
MISSDSRRTMRKFMRNCARQLVVAATLMFVLSAGRPSIGAEPEHAKAKQAETEEHAGSPNPLAVDPDLAIWTAVIFLLLLFVLGKFAWPQITAALEERERKIAANIAAAEALQNDAKRLLAEHEAKLAAAAGEVRALLDEARRDADHTKKSIEEEGRKAAKEELDRALREINRARDAAVQDLAVSSANVAIDLAQKIIRDKLTPETNNQIVRDAIAKLAPQPSNN